MFQNLVSGWISNEADRVQAIRRDAAELMRRDERSAIREAVSRMAQASSREHWREVARLIAHRSTIADRDPELMAVVQQA